MANSKDVQDHKDKYLDTCRKFLVEKLLERLKFQTELKNNRQDKNNMPHYLRSWRHKKTIANT